MPGLDIDLTKLMLWAGQLAPQAGQLYEVLSEQIKEAIEAELGQHAQLRQAHRAEQPLVAHDKLSDEISDSWNSIGSQGKSKRTKKSSVRNWQPCRPSRSMVWRKEFSDENSQRDSARQRARRLGCFAASDSL